MLSDVQLFAILWAVAHQAPLSMGFSRQEYWNGYQRGTKQPLVKVKEEREKAGRKLNIQKTKIMASRSITSWQIDGETVEIVTHYFWILKPLHMVTAAMKLKDACSLEENR